IEYQLADMFTKALPEDRFKYLVRRIVKMEILLEPTSNKLLVESSEELNETPLKEDLDNLFGHLYKEYYATRTLKVLDNSAVNTLDNEDTPSSSLITVEDHEAPQLVSSLEEPIANEPRTLVSDNHSDEQVQEDVAELERNTFINLFKTPEFEEANLSIPLWNLHQSITIYFENSKKHGVDGCDSIGTPMATARIDADLHGTSTDQTKYHSMIKGLVYLTASRPDIAFATFNGIPADPFTKPLLKERFEYLVHRINMRCMTPIELERLVKSYVPADSNSFVSADVIVSYDILGEYSGYQLVYESVPKRLEEEYHIIKDDTPFVSVYTTGKVTVKGMLIPYNLITDEILILRSIRIIWQSMEGKHKPISTPIPPPSDNQERDDIHKATLLSLALHKTTKIDEGQENTWLTELVSHKENPETVDDDDGDVDKKKDEKKDDDDDDDHDDQKTMKEMAETLNNLVLDLTVAKTNEFIKEALPRMVNDAVKNDRESSQAVDILKRKFEKSSASTSSCRNDAFHKRDHDEHQGDDGPPKGEKSAKRQKTSKGSMSARGSSLKQLVQRSKTSASERQQQQQQQYPKLLHLNVNNNNNNKNVMHGLRIQIIEVVRVTTKQQHELDYMEHIIVMRENDKPDNFSEADFKYLNTNDIEDMYYLCLNKKVNYRENKLLNLLMTFIKSRVIWERVHDFQLGIKSYQIKINLTTLTLIFPGIEECDPYSIVDKSTTERGLKEVKLKIFKTEFLKKAPLLDEKMRVVREWKTNSINDEASVIINP
nr:hypothetical protein [Tanacetum cinerariifolium]